LLPGKLALKVTVELFVHFGVSCPRFFLEKFVFLCFEDIMKSSFVDW
jgi:diphthamide synthase subunit DPH2